MRFFASSTLAALCAVGIPAFAQQAASPSTPANAPASRDSTQVLPEVQVTTHADENAEGQLWHPEQVLSGDALRRQQAPSLGETLDNQPGISSSGVAAASRPVLRGMDGPRVRILQNGMASQDLSALSPDHAVGLSAASARQVEIVRGPAALLYSSGSTGGTINLVNDRIPTELVGKATGEAQARYSSVDSGSQGSASLDGSSGKWGWHVDGDALNAGDYRIPGERVLGNPAAGSGRLPSSFSRQQNGGFGGSVIDNWGYAGLSVSGNNNRYGVPTLSGATIDMQQQRLDLDSLLKNPAPGLKSLRARLAYTDYRHDELDPAGQPETRFSNRAWEGRLDAEHQAWAGWRGRFGLQTENSNFSALNAGTGAPDTVRPTRSNSVAVFMAEERDFGPWNASFALRGESLSRTPDIGQARSFWLGSAAAGVTRTLPQQFKAGATFTSGRRAPAVDELYANGPHDATGTFDRGQSNLASENSQTLELNLGQENQRANWKASVYQSRIRNYIFGRLTGAMLDENGAPGGDFAERIYSQADATVRGAELQAAYNRRGQGFSLSGFADVSRGEFDAGGNLPLQPAARVGAELGYRRAAWQGTVSAVHAFRQNRLASFETNPAPAWTRLDASLAWQVNTAGQIYTLFLQGRNLLNQDIRLATSLLKDVAPQPGRNILLGLNARF